MIAALNLLLFAVAVAGGLAALGERDRARAERDAAEAEADELRVERDALEAALVPYYQAEAEHG